MNGATLAPAKLAETVAWQIQEWVRRDNLQEGDLIGSEANLVKLYGVSRPVFREAVRLLEHQGIVTMRKGPGGGLTVAARSVDSVAASAALYLNRGAIDWKMLYEARQLIELAALQMACERLTEDGLALLRRTMQAEQQRFDAEPHGIPSQLGMNDLHVVIADLAGNAAVKLFVELLINLVARQQTVEAQRDLTTNHAQHVGIVEAIEAGDFALARVRLAEHFQHIIDLRAQPASRRPARKAR